VTVSPASGSVPVGATLQLAAVTKDSGGNVLTGQTVMWTTGNSAVATVSASGLVTGVAAGSATITATSGGKSGMAAMTVTTATSGAPQPGATDTIVFQEGFESGNYSSWTQVPANDRYSISSDPTRVHSGKYSLQALYTPTDSYGELVRYFMPGYDEIYVKFYVMFEEGFQHGPHFLVVCGSTVTNSGSCFGKAAVVPNGTDFFYAGVDPDFVGDDSLRPLSFYTYWPDMSCCYGNRFVQTAPQIPLIGGQWQEVVFHIKLNTPGQSDGSQTLWVNGVKKIDMQNMRWRTTTDLRLNLIRFSNWTQSAPIVEHVWVDDMTVWRP